jgi:hypothetical protein
MTPMRQRLLLVAGWLVAAIGSGVVASGAVAVAGGQVLDRPLSPLTAAEVAALPVVGTVSIPEQIEPLASGGSDSTSRDTTDDGNGAATGPAGIEIPTGAGGASADDSVSLVPPNLDTARTATSGVDSVKESRIVGSDVAIIEVPGGSASVAYLTDRFSLLWATPRPGYVVGLGFDSPTSLTLTFTSNLRRYVIEVGLDDEGILVSTDFVATADGDR